MNEAIEREKVDFDRIFQEEQKRVDENVLNIPHKQKAEVLKLLEENEIQTVIQNEPQGNNRHKQILLYGVKLDNGQNLRITDIVNSVQNKYVLIDILTNVFENIIKDNRLAMPGKRYKNLEKFYFIIDGKYIVDQKSLGAMIAEYVQHVLNVDQEKYGDEIVDDNFTNFIKIDFISEYKKGKRYVPDKIFEEQICKQSVVLVKNTSDDNCLYSALFIALVLDGQQKDYSYKITFNGEELAFNKNIFGDEKGLTGYKNSRNKNLFFYTQQMIHILGDYQTESEILRSFSAKFNKNVIILDFKESFKNQIKPKVDDLLLLFRNDHYNVIRNYQQLYRNISKDQNSAYCFEHQQWFDKKKKCSKCFNNQYCKFCAKYHTVSKVMKQPIKCKKCGFESKYEITKECQENHNKICNQFKLCQHCSKIHYLKQFCQQQKAFDQKHFKTNEIKNEQVSFITYDIESYFKPCDDKKYVSEHIPFLICYQVVLYDKKENSYKLEEPEAICNKTPFTNFIEKLVELRHQYNISKVFAHNGGKYDTVLMLSQLVQQSTYKFKTLFNNGRLLQLTIESQHGDIFILDSYNLLNKPISSFSKSYGLDNLMKQYNIKTAEKFEQSYTFLTENILDYYLQNGKSQTIKYYYQNQGLKISHFKDGMFKNETDFRENYVNKFGDKDFVDQYKVYCKQDVTILSLGLIQMIKTSISTENINIIQYLTLPAMAYNKYLYESGKNMFDQQVENFNFKRSQAEDKLVSMITNDIESFNLLAKTNFKQLTVVKENCRFDQYNVDIIAKDGNKNYHIIEVDGIYFHGLIELQNDDPLINIMKERRLHHDTKAKYLEQHYKEKGYSSIIHITDQQINNFIKQNKLDIKLRKMQNIISDRDILRGGRTEYYYNYYKWNNKEKCLKGKDLTSLYPSMMIQNIPLGDCIVGLDLVYIEKMKAYVKQLQKITDPELKLEALLQGSDASKRIIQIKCKILCPQSLNHTVLNVKIENKLLAPVCRTCAELKCKDMNYNKSCNHSVEERALYGFFDEVEILHAMLYGYQLLEIYETHIYNKTSFNTPEYKGSDFIKRCIYYKTLFSDKDDYNEEVLDNLLENGIIADYKITDNDILLKRTLDQKEFDKVELNQAKKEFYKLIMNSCYGKTGQSKFRSVCEVGDINRLFQYDYNKEQYQTFMSPTIINDNYVIYNYEKNEELTQLDKCQANPSIAGRITALARTVLYFLQETIKYKYNGTLLYSDTDSCYCLLDKKYSGLKGFALKSTFGVKTEQKIDDANEFVAIAPKQYSYKNESYSHSTTKGITAEKQNKELGIVQQDNNFISLFDVYKDLVFGKQETFTAKQEKNFEKNRKTFQIFTAISYKTIQIKERKRESLELETLDNGEQFINTIPFGYIV